jgi:HSP20 family molecular chaperone IbpA
VKVDVHQFLPQELKVKVAENYVVVEGHHEEREDQHGLISRNFKRRYRLPENVKDDQLICDLSVDGVMLIRVPRLVESHHDPNAAKLVPIHLTGKPATAASSGVSKPSAGSGHHFHSLK